MVRDVATAVLALCALPAVAGAQTTPRVSVGGDVSVAGLVMPHQPADGRTMELRSRARVEVTADPSPWLRLKFDGMVEGLVADRDRRVDDAVTRVRDAWVEVRGERVEVRAGYGRLIWGRLDEIMPSDVLNPLDTARYFLDGRAEARLPVAFLRGRVFLPRETSLEGVLSLPGRRGRFDELDEPSSPFNLLRDLVLPAAAAGSLDRREPEAAWDTLQVGGRLSTTFRRVDASVSAYRGYESFGVLSFEPAALLSPGPLVVGRLVERYSRFTMVAADAETVAGPWALRAEAAYFPSRDVTTDGVARQGRALDAGVGLDRSAGSYRVFTSVVWHRDWTTAGPSRVNHDLSLIGSLERRFRRDRYLVRVFGVVNPVDESAFVRGLAAWSVRDNVSVEVSGGVFGGTATGDDTLSRFRDRDFAFLRLRWYF